MFRFCLADTRRSLTIWWFLFVGLIYIVSSWPYLIAAKLYNLNISEFFLISFSNQYYFLLILFPLLFLYLLRLNWTPSISILSRGGNFSTYIWARFVTLSLSLLVIVSFHLFITFLMSIGLRDSAETRLFGYAYFDTILPIFENQFRLPQIAIYFVLLNYLLGIICISSIVGLILVYFPRNIKIVALVALYFTIFFGVQRSITWNIPALFLSNYILLSNAIIADLFPESIVLMIGISLSAFVFLWKRWWKAKSW